MYVYVCIELFCLSINIATIIYAYVMKVYIYFCVDVINVACVGNRELRKAVEEALFIFPAVVSVVDVV